MESQKTAGNADTALCEPVFTRRDWLTAAITALLVLIFYFCTLAPTVTLEQSGALVVAGDYLGVGRMPGYPVWHLLAKVFTMGFGFVRYHGQPNPAWATNFMSAFFGALSCGLIALLVVRLARLSGGHASRESGSATVVAVLSGVLVATGHVLWSQSVITETHTLTLFFVLLFLVAALAWTLRADVYSAAVMAAAFGIGLAQSHMIVLLLPSLVLALLMVDPRLCRDFCVAFVLAYSVPALLLYEGATASGFVLGGAVSLVVAGTTLYCFSSRRRTVLIMLALITLGLLLFSYLPLASEGKAPMQFGYPRIWEGFLHLISRGQYEKMVPTDVWGDPHTFLRQLKWYCGLLGEQFPGPAAVVALVPVIFITRLRTGAGRWWAVCLLTFFMFSVVVLIGSNPHGDVHDLLVQSLKFIPSFAVWGVLLGTGIVMALEWIARWQRDVH